MASIEIEIADRKYRVACRDGEEASLQSAAALVDRRARDATAALGTLSEMRQLLFAALLLADDLKGARDAEADRPPPLDPEVGAAMEILAERLEVLAEHAEARVLPYS